MKLFFMSALAILMTVSFTACGSGDSGDSTIGISSENNRTSTSSSADNNQTPKDAVSHEIVLSPVGPFGAGDFGVINLGEDYPFEEGVLFLDIRNQWERDDAGYPEGSLGGAVYQYREHAGNGKETSKDKYKKRYIYQDFVQKVKDKASGDINKKIVIICASGSRTGAEGDKTKDSAAKLLSENGFSNIYHVKGGFGAWDKEKLPIVDN